MDTDYKSGPASLFASHARRLSEVKKWTWCSTFGNRVWMTWDRVQDGREYYRCPCGAEHSWVVR